MCDFIFKRMLSILFLFLFTCCSSPDKQEWELQQIKAKSSLQNSGRMLFVPLEQKVDFEIELARDFTGCRFYLNFFTVHVRSLHSSSSEAEALILFDNDDSWTIYPYLFSGGQRLLLPEDVTEYLIDTLLDGRSFSVKIGNYHLTVYPENFEKIYTELMKIEM